MATERTQEAKFMFDAVSSYPRHQRRQKFVAGLINQGWTRKDAVIHYNTLDTLRRHYEFLLHDQNPDDLYIYQAPLLKKQRKRRTLWKTVAIVIGLISLALYGLSSVASGCS